MVATGALAVLEGRPAEALPRGDHVLVVVAVEQAEVRGGEPLVYFEGDYR
jgi:flavin reductase (DIM6/NTAB) family NADH-FMN oxidoreductase RutF